MIQAILRTVETYSPDRGTPHFYETQRLITAITKARNWIMS